MTGEADYCRPSLLIRGENSFERNLTCKEKFRQQAERVFFRQKNPPRLSVGDLDFI